MEMLVTIMKKIGILTFHRVYNYGAVIQAYSLQQFLIDNGYDNEIIDFSKKKQNDYTNVISIHNGIKRFLKTLMLTPVAGKRISRKNKFDNFFNQKLLMSGKTYQNEKELVETNYNYNIFMVGSDQVWNVTKKSDASTAYFFRFADESKKRVAYAPSIGIATENDLAPYKRDLKRFHAISCREQGGADHISKIIDSDVKVVLDPTLLVDQSALVKLTEPKEKKSYILYYSLDGFDKRDNNMDILCALKEKFQLELKIVMPEWPFHDKYGEDIIDAGPEDFLTLIRNATLICTNSFHGTALSIKLEKPFFVLEDVGIKDERKRSLLNQLGLQNRIISTAHEADVWKDYTLDYAPVLKKLHSLKKASEDFLISALRDD